MVAIHIIYRDRRDGRSGDIHRTEDVRTGQQTSQQRRNNSQTNKLTDRYQGAQQIGTNNKAPHIKQQTRGAKG